MSGVEQGASTRRASSTPGSAQDYLRGVLGAVGVDAPNFIQEPVHFTLDSVAFSLFYRFAEHGDMLILSCDFGEPHAHSTAQALLRLMEMNLSIFGTGHACFCADAKSGRIQLLTMHAVSLAGAADIASAAHVLSTQARQWRLTNFL